MSSNNGDKTAKEITEERLKVIAIRIKELEPQKDKEEVKKELAALYEEKNKLSPKPEEVKDFKVGEIWIKDGRVMIDAIDGFWNNKLRAIGMLEECKEIVRDYWKETQKHSKISIVDKLGMKNFVNGLKRRF